jgi:pSer/pThr/pTyr-binding forkhead associated (FHA) protein
MQVRLKVLSGTHAGKEIALKEERCFVGRGEACHIRPKSESVSRKHCAFVQKDGRVLLADLNSRNGTFVNDVRLEAEKAKILRSGDRIRIGQLDFEIVIEIGLGGAKKPEVHSVKEAVTRVAESSATAAIEKANEKFDIDSWLSDADAFDRTLLPQTQEPETQMMSSDETTRMQASTEDSTADSASSSGTTIQRPDKKGPMKLPKMLPSGPSTKNSTDAASNALKKYFGGR